MEALQMHPKDLVDAKLFRTEEQVVQEALRHLLQNRPEVRIALAVYRYQSDEEVSLAKAAALAGVSIERMKEILVARAVPLRLGPETIEDAQNEVSVLEQWFDSSSR
jgi:predicted HTH domain antitoxin